jgi:nucleoside-triphosphatase THEP1
MRITIVTGERDSGKTRWCAEHLADAEGVVAMKRFLDGEHIGYDARNPRSGASVPLLRIATGAGNESPRIGKYRLLDAGFAEAERWIRRGLTTDAPALVIDEIGRLELGGGGYASVLHETVASRYGGSLYLVVRRELVESVTAVFLCGRTATSGETVVLTIVDVDRRDE